MKNLKEKLDILDDAAYCFEQTLQADVRPFILHLTKHT